MTTLRNTSMSSRMTRKGQVTVPKAVREALAIHPGAKVSFELTPDGAKLLRGDAAEMKAKLEGLASFPGWTWTGTTEEFMEMTRGAPHA